MPTTAAHSLAPADPFDLDVQIEVDDHPVWDVFSSIACGYTECCTSHFNCPMTPCGSCDSPASVGCC